jgi:hypothetical protein
VVRYRLDREVLAVSVTVLSPEWDEKIGGDEEQDQGDDCRNYERLETFISIAQAGDGLASSVAGGRKNSFLP